MSRSSDQTQCIVNILQREGNAITKVGSYCTLNRNSMGFFLIKNIPNFFPPADV